ncbi:hypothetical protein PIROE2DRAFT_2651, partial [Piromyces sp. E2]
MRKRVINMKKKINYYKNLNIVQLINELNQKTNLVLKLSEKLKKYTDEEVVSESDINIGILNSIQDLMDHENETINIIQMKKDYDEDVDEKVEIKKSDNDKSKKIDTESSCTGKELKYEKQRKHHIKHETAKSKIHKVLYGTPKNKNSRPMMSYHNNPLSVDEERIHKDIEKYPFIYYLIYCETMSTISYDNTMTKDNYLEIINNLIKENCLLKKKITDQNTNS